MMQIPPAGGNIWTNTQYLLGRAGNSPQPQSAASQILGNLLSHLDEPTKQAYSSILSALMNGAEVQGTDAGDIILALAHAKISAGGGDDIILAGDDAEIDAGDGDDGVFAGSHATVHAGAGNDMIMTMDGATIETGSGNNYVSTYSYSSVTAGAGNDVIRTYDHATVDAGDGNDIVQTSSYSTVAGGGGNDVLQVSSHSQASGGDGNDVVIGYSYVDLNGGAGNDVMEGGDHSTVDAGEGNDLVFAYGYSTVQAGAGDDVIITSVNNGPNQDYQIFGYETVDAGEGNDYIQTGAHSNVTGGTGDDVIRLTGEGSTVNFAKGDGKDTILSRDDLTINLTGYSKDDVIIDDRGDSMVISFKGSDDSMTLDMSKGMTVHLAFDDESSLDVASTSTNSRKSLATAVTGRVPILNGQIMFENQTTNLTAAEQGAQLKAQADALKARLAAQ